ncbi:hypothetical protein DCC39_10565 [Pueribacillus theae]|uniref:LysM domain-containing protein n=1 Tax=Pueribacillus theae TaxID=2171751 RepID=A0A2U1K0K3_9BACI|nr:SafA/ExsA family spore coat assembly protein [Pueribacillus theae]PWA10724.1 hypothetical protein DCC39_10565 [Pueribacillus theae]
MKIHIVQKGDTLWKIAEKYNVNFEELKNMNTQLSDPNMLMPGMKIKVPTGGMHVKKHKKEAPIIKEQPTKHVPMPPPVPKKFYDESPESPEGFHPMPEVNIPINQPAPLPVMQAPTPMPCGCPPMMPPPPPVPCGCQPVMPPCPHPMPGMVHGMGYPAYGNVMMPPGPVMGEMEMNDESSSFMPSPDYHHHMGTQGMPYAPYYGGYEMGGQGNPHMYGNPQPYYYGGQQMHGYSPMMPGYSQAPLFPGYGSNPYGMESSYMGHYRESENEEKSNDDDDTI